MQRGLVNLDEILHKVWSSAYEITIEYATGYSSHCVTESL